jgi:hypothetical protein
MNGADILARSAAVAATPVEDETFLVDAEGREIYHLDPIASGLWRALETPQSLDHLHRTFCGAFPDVGAERIRNDLEACVGQLLRLGFVVKAG